MIIRKIIFWIFRNALSFRFRGNPFSSNTGTSTEMKWWPLTWTDTAVPNIQTKLGTPIFGASYVTTSSRRGLCGRNSTRCPRTEKVASVASRTAVVTHLCCDTDCCVRIAQLSEVKGSTIVGFLHSAREIRKPGASKDRIGTPTRQLCRFKSKAVSW